MVFMDRNSSKESENNQEQGKKSIWKEVGLKKWILMGGAGILLLLLSVPDLFSGSEKTKSGNEETQVEMTDSGEEEWETTYVRRMEEQLSEILSSVEGVGSNRVMITLNSSKEEIIEKDQPYTQENEEQTEQGSVVSDRERLDMSEETVFYELEDGTKKPYVIKVMEPQIAGIVVVAKGGDNPQVKQEIINAAQVLFSVPAHRIIVMKMKSAEGR